MDDTNEIVVKWQCSLCEHEFMSGDLVPVCPECHATGDNIIGLE